MSVPVRIIYFPEAVILIRSLSPSAEACQKADQDRIDNRDNENAVDEILLSCGNFRLLGFQLSAENLFENFSSGKLAIVQFTVHEPVNSWPRVSFE